MTISFQTITPIGTEKSSATDSATLHNQRDGVTEAAKPHGKGTRLTFIMVPSAQPTHLSYRVRSGTNFIESIKSFALRWSLLA